LRKAIVVCGIALAVCLPYLLYTYSLTGKIFYWGNSGGLQLYSMSTPYPGEYGDWLFIEHVKANKLSAEHHLAFLQELDKLPSIERDDALKRAGIRNILNHPLKYFENWVCNVSRLFFDYPYSYVEQTPKTLFYMVPGMFILVLATLSIYPAWRRRRDTPQELHVLMGFLLISLAGSSLVSAYARQFWILTPILDVFMVTVLVRGVVLAAAPSAEAKTVEESAPLPDRISEKKTGSPQP